MSFITVDDLKAELGIPLSSTKFDDRLTTAVNAANAAVLQYLCLDQVDPKEYVLSVDLDPDLTPWDELWFETQPVISITEVLDNNETVESTGYRARMSRIRRLCDGGWSTGVSCDGTPNVQVTLQAGFDNSDPMMALQLAMIAAGVLDLAKQKFNGPPDGFKSERIGRYVYERFKPSERVGSHGFASWPDSLTEALSPFFRPFTGPMLTRSL